MAFVFNHMASSSQGLNLLWLRPRSVRTSGCLWKGTRGATKEGKNISPAIAKAVSHPPSLIPKAPNRLHPSCKCAPKLNFWKRPRKCTSSERKGLCVRPGGTVWLTSEISLLACSNSILFIIAQCSDAKCFPSESEGFKERYYTVKRSFISDWHGIRNTKPPAQNKSLLSKTYQRQK